VIPAFYSLLAVCGPSAATTKPVPPHVELVAVCNITADGVTAWSADRRPLPDLARKLETQLSSQDYSNINVRVGRKNRWLVFRTNAPNIYTQVQLNVGGRNVYGSLNFNDDSMRSLQFIPVATAKTERAVDATATITVITGEYIRFAPRKGQEFRIGKATYQLGEFVKSEVARQPGWGGFSGGQGAGVIVDGIQGLGEHSERQGLTTNTKAFQWTAVATGPAPDVTWGYNVGLFDLANQSLQLQGGQPIIEYVPGLGAIRVVTQIDPATVGMMSFPITETKTFEFRKVPLDR
jgi:hypothetical protein